MSGAVFFTGQYGSTAQYAEWISEATGLPVIDANNTKADPSSYDFLVLGSSVIVYKLTIGKWIRAHLVSIVDKPTLVFTVSGAAAGPKLDTWVAQSLPESLVSRMKHVPLRGRLNYETVSWWVKLLLRIGSWMNDDPQGKKEEREGFDYMEKAGIEPIVDWVQQRQSMPAAEIRRVDRPSATVV